MKKERIMIKGVKYRYIINDSNEIETAKPVSKEVLDLIKDTLIKKGKYQEFDWPEIPQEKNYSEKDLKTRFQKWAKIELKMYREEVKDPILLKAIDEEIERREKNDNSRTRRLLEESKDEN